MPAIDTPDYSQTNNKGLHILLEIFDRYYTETMESHQSRNGNQVHTADVQRLKDYVNDLNQFIDYWAARGTLDMPNTSNVMYKLPTTVPPELGDSQNYFWYDHTLEMYQIRESVRMSQSRNQAQGFHPDDVKRWQSYFADRITFFDAYVANAQPVDLPQSSSNATVYLEDKVDYSPGDSGIVT